jgi:hypothetical protein
MGGLISIVQNPYRVSGIIFSSASGATGQHPCHPTHLCYIEKEMIAALSAALSNIAKNDNFLAV